MFATGRSNVLDNVAHFGYHLASFYQIDAGARENSSTTLLPICTSVPSYRHTNNYLCGFSQNPVCLSVSS